MIVASFIIFMTVLCVGCFLLGKEFEKRKHKTTVNEEERRRRERLEDQFQKMFSYSIKDARKR